MWDQWTHKQSLQDESKGQNQKRRNDDGEQISKIQNKATETEKGLRMLTLVDTRSPGMQVPSTGGEVEEAIPAPEPLASPWS